MKKLFSKRIISVSCLIGMVVSLFSGISVSAGIKRVRGTGPLVIKDGMLQPILEYSDPRDPDYSNEDSDILRFCVYVETDYDTDADGSADLVKALVQVPRPAAEGKYKAATIYDPTPYNVGVVEENEEGAVELYVEQEFDYNELYKKGRKRRPAGEMGTLSAAEAARPDKDWNYTVPGSLEYGYSYLGDYDYYLVRGFAVVEASGIGTYGSEGYELCGTDLERDSHKCVVEWLTGQRRAFTDRFNRIEVAADWSNGKVAMCGTSYGGTLPFEVATTGVKGLETIVPYAGIASWYDYTNSQGVSTMFNVNYKDYLASYNCGGTYLDKDWTVPDERYGSWLWQVSRDEDATNGDYAPVWAESDYSDDYEKINCSALIVHGLNDYNVTTKQADLMYQAFKRAGKTAKLIFHQNGHMDLYSYQINGEPWLEILNKWLSHYLYGVENGIDKREELTWQDNVTGEFKFTDHWRDLEYVEAPVPSDSDVDSVTSIGLAEYIEDFAEDRGEAGLVSEMMDSYFDTISENFAASYEVELLDDTTICGVPEVKVRLSSARADLDGLMITAALVDSREDGEPFKAFMLKSKLYDTVPKRVVDEIEPGGGLPLMELYEHVQSSTRSKAVSFGWTDLRNPGLGYDSSDYEKSEDLVPGKFYDYTFYMLPTVYTVAPGHRLKLVLTAWDPFRAFLDEGYELDMSLTERIEHFSYSYTVDNSSIEVRLPVLGG